MNALGTVAILIVGVVGYLVMAEAMNSWSTLRYPRVIAALVAALGCIGLRQAGDGVIAAVVIPSATLLLACSAIWVAMRLTGKGKKLVKHIKHEKVLSAVEEPSANAPHNPWRISK